MIFVDTSVWSLAFRRSNSAVQIKEVLQLHELISQDAPLAVTGIVMQELLSGLREEAQFKRLEGLLSAFPLVLASQAHHVLAAQIANRCRQGGIATADKDFEQMAGFCDLRLYRG